MAKIKPYSVPIKERRRIIGDFFGLVSNLKTKQEIIDLFVGLLTPSEALMQGRRLQVAKAILSKKTFEEIRKETGVSFETIAKVEKWLYERDEAYKKVLSRRWPSGRAKKGGMQYNSSELDKYPQHRFLKKMLGLK